MTDPRYRPRDYCNDPENFGKAMDLRWVKVPEGREAARLAAAHLQHQFSVRIRTRIRDQKVAMTTYAKASGMGYDRLLKILRGDVVMRLEDVAMADLLVGEVSDLARVAPPPPQQDEDSGQSTVADPSERFKDGQLAYRKMLIEWNR